MPPPGAYPTPLEPFGGCDRKAMPPSPAKPFSLQASPVKPSPMKERVDHATQVSRVWEDWGVPLNAGVSVLHTRHEHWISDLTQVMAQIEWGSCKAKLWELAPSLPPTHTRTHTHHTNTHRPWPRRTGAAARLSWASFSARLPPPRRRASPPTGWRSWTWISETALPLA